MTSTNVPIPAYNELLWPTLRAIRDLGHSGTIEEIEEKVIEQEGFSDAQQAVLHKDGPSTEIEYRLAWGRTYLKKMGALDNMTRGVWTTTEEGRHLTEDEVDPRWRAYVAELREKRKRRERAAKDAGADDTEGADTGETDDWREELLQSLFSMSPEGFERLAQRLLRAAGFVNTSITARAGDGGIDGMGAYRLSLVSFPVVFQCKRYRGSVGPDKVRDFRGAMAGRGDKGLLITTGAFTGKAKREAAREGAPPIDLIDGEELCELLKSHNLGVRVTVRQVEDVEVLTDFFVEL